MAQYRIRAPFSVHLERIAAVNQGGRVHRRRETTSHFHGSTVDLSDADAMAHMHKLEPVDETSRALFAAYHEKQAEIRAARQAAASGPSLATEVTSAVMAALTAAGVVKAPRG
jgi:hypothetical protein